MATKRKRSGRDYEGSDARERGSSLMGILSVVAILGILVAITLSLSLGGSTPPARSPQAGTTTTTVPKDAASGATEATLAACEANFAIVDSAVETYRALNGSPPPAGSAWSTSDANGGPLLQSWPSGGRSYRLVWNGQQLSVVPTGGTASRGSIGQGPDVSGCFAVKSS